MSRIKQNCLIMLTFLLASSAVCFADGVLISIYGNNGRYLSSEDGKKELTCNRFAAYEWETFVIEELEDGSVSLLGNNGLYLSMAVDGESLSFSAEQVGENERFRVVDLNGSIALRGSNGRFLSSENGAKPLTCNRTSIGIWETFSVEVLDK